MEIEKLTEALITIRDFCNEHENCEGEYELFEVNGGCQIALYPPYTWEVIRKVSLHG